MAEVSGSEEETGALGWFFLQRLGAFVEAHAAVLLTDDEKERMATLAAADAQAVNEALARDGLPTPPPPEWPETPEASPPAEQRVRFGLLGDPHIGLKSSNRLIPAAVEDLNREGLAFSVTVGDITQNGDASYFRLAREILDGFDHPHLVTLGNHDMWGGGGQIPVGPENFADSFGVLPYGVHEADGVRVIVLNSADPTPSPFPPFDLVAGAFTDEPNESVPGGVFSEEVADFMASIGKAGPTFIVLHHPPDPYLGLPPLTFGLDEPSTRLLAELVDRSGAWAVFCGHTHRSARYDFAGVPFIEIPSTKEWPFAYGVVDVSDEGWVFNLRPLSDEALVSEASASAGVMFRRYARGPKDARALSVPR
jgi:3',5'-cyclic AMP phosphodiesterase CpdA